MNYIVVFYHPYGKYYPIKATEVMRRLYPNTEGEGNWIKCMRLAERLNRENNIR